MSKKAFIIKPKPVINEPSLLFYFTKKDGGCPYSFLKDWAKYEGLLNPTIYPISEIESLFCLSSSIDLRRRKTFMNSTGDEPVKTLIFRCR